MDKNYFLSRSAKEGYRGYVLAYASHSLKHIFNVNNLDLEAVAKGFGFSAPPRINLNLRATGERIKKRGGGGGFGDMTRKAQIQEIQRRSESGHAFSASNPYGKREKGDKRQFTR